MFDWRKRIWKVNFFRFDTGFKKNFETGDITINCRDHGVGYVPQECYISEGTIESNIAFGVSKENINKENLINTAKEAQIFDFVDSSSRKI